MNDIEAIGHLIQIIPSVVQIYRIRKKTRNIVSRNIKQSAINLTKIVFYEPFMIYDGIKWLNLRLKQTRFVNKFNS